MTQQTPGTADPMRTVAEVTKQLGIGTFKFYDLINSGQLQAFDLNHVQGEYARPGRAGGRRRSLRVRQSEIDRFLAERKLPA